MIAVAALLVVLAILGVALALSWHFSSEVVAPGDLPPSVQTTVEAVGPHRVVLARSEETERPGVYGLDWPAGHAIVGRVLSGSADTVVRRLRTRGSYLPAGSVTLDPDVYAGSPRHALGMPTRMSRYPMNWDRCRLGWYGHRAAPGRTSYTGLNGNLEGGLPLVPTTAPGRLGGADRHRNDLGAPQSSDGLHHMGLTEWHGLAAAARYALSHGARRLVLVGTSMGGAIATQFIERSPLAPEGRRPGLGIAGPFLESDP